MGRDLSRNRLPHEADASRPRYGLPLSLSSVGVGEGLSLRPVSGKEDSGIELNRMHRRRKVRLVKGRGHGVRRGIC